ncbi:MAG: hypothetical protein LUD40_14425 [Phocaeicola dorei]|nr:hypothetical protein [Phocaeicola dorei]
MKNNTMIIACLCAVGIMNVSMLHVHENMQGTTRTRSYKVEEVVVTGTRNETDIRHLPMTISVVGRQNLEHTYQPSVLPALTEQLPGLFITGRGIMESECSDRNKMNLPAILMFGRIYKVGCL